jgi:hypothetical protein
LEKDLALEPRHPLLHTSAGYQQMRLGNLDKAIAILEGVISYCCHPHLLEAVWPIGCSVGYCTMRVTVPVAMTVPEVPVTVTV